MSDIYQIAKDPMYQNADYYDMILALHIILQTITAQFDLVFQPLGLSVHYQMVAKESQEKFNHRKRGNLYEKQNFHKDVYR